MGPNVEPVQRPALSTSFHANLTFWPLCQLLAEDVKPAAGIPAPPCPTRAACLTRTAVSTQTRAATTCPTRGATSCPPRISTSCPPRAAISCPPRAATSRPPRAATSCPPPAVNSTPRRRAWGPHLFHVHRLHFRTIHGPLDSHAYFSSCSLLLRFHAIAAQISLYSTVLR